jgi:hypothetical protein
VTVDMFVGFHKLLYCQKRKANLVLYFTPKRDWEFTNLENISGIYFWFWPAGELVDVAGWRVSVFEPISALSRRLIALNTKVSTLDFGLEGRRAGIRGIHLWFCFASSYSVRSSWDLMR